MTDCNKEFFSGERLYWGVSHTKKNMPRDYFDRYIFTANLIDENSVVVDASCGSGYGSEILSGRCKKVFGFDVSDHALQFAREHHQRENISFARADFNVSIPLEANIADVVVSFKTMENVARQEIMLGEFARILKRGGTLVISSLDADIAISENPFHVHRITKQEFIEELEKDFIIKDLYGQNRHVISRPSPVTLSIIGIIKKADVFGLRHFFSPRRIGDSLFEKMGLGRSITPLEKIGSEPSGHEEIIVVCVKK